MKKQKEVYDPYYVGLGVSYYTKEDKLLPSLEMGLNLNRKISFGITTNLITTGINARYNFNINK